MSENLINDQNQPFTEGKTDYINSLLADVTNGVEGVYANELGDKIKQGLTDKIENRELDDLAAETAIAMCTKHYNYNIVATKIVIGRLHSTVQSTFSESMELLEELGVLHPDFITFVKENRTDLDLYIKKERDFDLDFFGFKTLEKSYLQRKNGVIVETPQYLFMRVACAIQRPNLENVFNVYDDLSQKYYIHATPTLFNAGMRFQQLSSCYLVAMQDDSITGIYDTLKECAQISKWAGGIGVHIHQIRGKNSKIKSNNGTSDGIVPMLRVFNDTARYCNQAGKRPGSFAVYLEPWHSDVEAFLDLKKNHGNEEERARDLFYALWIPDLFMKQVGADGDWYLMTPNDSVGLADVYGKEFEDLYWKYVEDKKFIKKMKARELWTRILHSQIETGVPYMLYKDACNQKSNQKNLGTIKSSNLCCEIVQYSDKDETAVCNLASIGLPMYVTESKSFNHELLGQKVRQIVRNLNRVIDINFYPTENSHRSNMRHRPIGIGVQGLADVFMDLGLDWESEPARKLNRDIFETIYYYSMSESCELAVKEKPYQSYEGSPISQGKFQFDLWKNLGIGHSGLYDWESLRKKVMVHGVRNSLMVAPMPTASTSQILGFNETIEPITSNIYSRRTLAGSFMQVNKRLMRDCMKLGIWSESLKNEIITNDGSIQEIGSIPKSLRDIYKTVWDIKQKVLINLACDRGRYICQSQSLNLYLSKIDMNTLGSMHLYGWIQGLKTGLYYLRIKPVAKTQQFTVEPKAASADVKVEEKEEKEIVCRREAGCTTCSA
jgi:ribonucleoside-diphosphate reductase alpha chain